jgi:hypothetical protein
VATNDDRLGPAGNATRNVLNDNGLTEDDTTADVTDGTVGRLPHLLEGELLDTGLIRGDGGALDADLVFLDGVCAVDSDLIVSGITVLDAQVEVLDVEVKVGVDELKGGGLVRKFVLLCHG